MDVEGKADEKQRSIREGKRVQEPVNTELVVDIFEGITIDERDLTQPYTGPEYCRVMIWVYEEGKYVTQVVKSLEGFLRFDQRIVIPLHSPVYHYLYIELLRGLSSKDPGTSTGIVVMGRAKIRLPPWSSQGNFQSKFDLVGMNRDRCVVFKGYLHLSMKLHRFMA